MENTEPHSFNLYPKELSPLEFATLLEGASRDIRQNRKSTQLTVILNFLHRITEVSQAQFRDMAEEPRNEYIAWAYWLTNIREKVDGGNVQLIPMHAYRIQHWVKGKCYLLTEVGRNPSSLNAPRAIGFLETWENLLRSHHQQTLIL